MTYEKACSQAYRWGEDGLAGFCHSTQRLCLALALWNGADPILKERLFGLSGPEGSHGEDVKELYWHLDAVPSHSYLRMHYKYPQRQFPYEELRAANRGRSRAEGEFELIDTGILAEDRYFDVFVEYAKADEADILMRVTVHNRGPEAAPLHVIPQLWFANHWSWREGHPKPGMAMPPKSRDIVSAVHRMLGEYTFHVEAHADLLFCENKSNPYAFGMPPEAGVFKDGLHDRIVGGWRDAVRPRGRGPSRGLACADAGAWGAMDDPRPAGARAPDPAAVHRVRRSGRSAAGGGGCASMPSCRRDIEDEDARLVQRQGLRRHDLEQSSSTNSTFTDGFAAIRPCRSRRRSGCMGGIPIGCHLSRRRHHIDAGQVGVSVVRGVGSGVSLRDAGADRSGLRQAAIACC